MQSVLNVIAVQYDTISALPLSVILKMVAIWLFVALPLSVVGTIFGRHWLGKSDFPCRVNSMVRYGLPYDRDALNAIVSPPATHTQAF